VGFGSMVTFGSYLRDSDEIAEASLRVTLTDILISLFAGLLIFPIVLSASNISLNEPGLLFKAVPRFFISLDGGMIFGLLFFLCLYLAALGASIGLFEMIVSNTQEKFKLSRQSSVWLTGGCAFVLSLVPTLLTKADFHNFTLQKFDSLLINWLLPLTALGLGLAIGWGVDKNEVKKYFVVETRVETVTLFPYWYFFIRWVVHGIFIAAIIANL
jgi:NSS family neurotransmitter:Na+ symporter